ncbi:MAG: START-like domain-containing protein [Bacteroidetes bacterium]|nr:START-like domain-containing protein [Bacteroidota bacterium]
MKKEKIQLEYIIKASTKSLYTSISTPEGLSEWFADEVNVEQGSQEFEFVWNGESQKARVILQKALSFMRFQWEDEDEAEYFEFRIVIDPLTNDIVFVITDFVEPGEKDDAEQLWNLQVETLKKSLGAN